MNGEPELDGQADPKPLGGQSDPNDLIRLADLENTESYTNGISFLDSLQLRSRNSEELGTEKLNNSILADLAELEDPKSPKSTYEPELLRDNVSKDFVGDKIPDLLANNTDSKAAKHSEILLQNNESCNKDTERLYDNSTDSQETTNDNDESLDAGATNESDENVVKETETIHGLESDHNSEDDSCQYVDDAEDPISSDPKEDEQEILNKLISKESEKGTFKIVTINKYNTDEENSSDSSGSDEEPKAEAVSFTSDGDNSRDDKLKCSDVFMLDDKTDNLNGTKSLEVHEIVSDNSENDDCIVTAVDKVTKSITKRKNTKSPPGELRRSSRAVKRKKYDDEIEELDDDDASDLEEVQTQDPLQNKHIAISNPKSIVGIASKIKRKIGQKMLDTIVIVDSPEKNRATKPNILSQNLYQKIAARGTSVTPISTKLTETKSIATQADSEPILPTLTDDMFVVEAPSFIVPYVYEKPAPMPFKEFVDKWGKEIEEEKLKEAEELKEKKKLEKAKREKERQEKRERGEEVQESEEEETEEINRKKAERAEKKERRRRKKLKEDDDVSWDGSSSEESDDESISDDESQTKEALIGDIKDVAPPPPKTDSYFDLSLGKFFMDIGSNLVQQYVQADLLHQQNKKLRREKKSGQSTKSRQVSIALLSNNLELSKKTNAPFTFEQKICKLCSFQTESALALEYHLETPHMKNNIYVCSYCSLELHGPHNILFHLDKTHAIKGRLERPPALHQCVNCPFEDHVKGKLARHLVACAKKFKPETNLAPPVEWEHPAKISKLTRPRAPVPFQAAQFARHPTDGGVVSGIRIPIGTDLSHQPRMQMTPVRPTGVLIRQASPHQPTIIANAKKQPNNAILISPAPRQATPIQPLNATNAKGVVMCEICDGYIKDLEQLRNHMQWIHKVKIHPKMIYNRPPLNCQKCQFRFFTDQGLERHLLGSHGLVTSAIQEAANKGKDAGRCPVCGRAYQRKLLAHVSRDHNLVLKPAHLSYKCTVCTATFGMYRQFESHVYSTHSVVAKKAMDKKPPAPVKGNPNDDAAKQLKNNENITIIPQPVKIGAAKRK